MKVKQTIDKIWNSLISWMEKHWFLFYAFLVIVMAILCFYHLGANPIQDWDEARHGINAYEIVQSGDPIVTTYLYKTDYYNLKPPLSMWLIALSYRLFGYNRIALRLYSAICYLFTTVFTSLQVKKRHGVIASLICMFFFTGSMITLIGHGARNGDADALFMLAFVLSMFYTLRYAETEKPHFLYVASFAFSIAFLAKSFHAGMIVITMGLFLVSVKKLRTIQLRDWIGCITTALLPILLWAIWRYTRDGFDFLSPMFGLDVFQRVTSALDGNDTNIFTYLRFMSGDIAWLSMMLLGFFGAGYLYAKHQPLSMSGRLYVLWFAIPFVLYTLSSTRFGWYVYPCAIALIAGASPIAAKILKGRSFGIMSCIVLLLFIFPVGAMTISNAQAINRQRDRDTVQQFMRLELTREDEYAGKNCYIAYGSFKTGDWGQGDILQAQLSADLMPCKNGIDGFTEEEDSYLILARELYNTGEFENFAIVEENQNFMMLYHVPNPST